MFQLNDAVRKWRSDFAQQGAVRSGDIDELESHLLDDMEQMAGTGLSEEEAFLVATRRLGTPPEISAEFGKVHAGRVWALRLFWMLAGYAVVSLTLGLAGVLGRWLSAGMMVSGMVESPVTRLAVRSVALAALFVPVLVLALVPDGRRFLVGMADRVVGWARRHPVLMAISCLLVYVGIRVLAFARNAIVARMVGVEAFGQEAYYGMYFQMGWMVVFPLMMLGLIIWTYRSAHGRRV